ncbi:MAG: phosphopantetheine-binding protein [Betaproteobacteria bacterium]|nr:phosphopantetheine-binding protein [Betaproteobacteria bacterium]MCL2885290.1 phosphopantetheine-binding protein [Betaproteobacteria bacterium]
MGLDSIELVLAFEDEFGISIDDADAAELVTPRAVADYVIGRLGNVSGARGHCLSQAGFYRIRSALVRQFGALRKDVRPDTPIRNFLGRNIRRQWLELGKAIDASQLPSLECRKSIAYPLLIGIPVSGLTLAVLAGASRWWLVSAIILFFLAALIAIEKLSDLIPKNLTTIASLVPYTRVKNPEEWTRDYVLQKVIQITSMQLGVPIEKIQPDSHFVDDLGMD